MNFQKFHETDLDLVQNSNNESKSKEEDLNDNESLNNEDQKAANKLIDDIGFSRYHYLIFSITALILICGGVQQLMLSIVLSMIVEKDNLSTYHLALIMTSEYLGFTAASILVNIVTHYISNKRAIQIFAILTLIFTGISIFSLEFYLATLSRFFTGLSLGIIDILIYLNLVESVPTKIRGFISSFILIFFPLGQFIISVICYFELDFAEGNSELTFRYLLMIPFAIVALILIILLPFLQESARRMIALHNIRKSINIVQKISRFNKDDNYLLEREKIMNNLVKNAGEDIKVEKDNIKKIFNKSNTMFEIKSEEIKRTENLDESKISSKSEKSELNLKFQFYGITGSKYLNYTIILWITAALTGFIFNGIFFMLPTTAPKLNKTTFKDVILSVGMELPSNCLTSFLIEVRSIGRLRLIKIGYLCTILICVICFTIGYDYLVINCLLKFFITIPSNILVVYSSEIFEGRLRTFGVSSINFCKRIATITSPFIITYFEYEFGSLGPYYLFGPFTTICFLLSIMLHTETRGVPLDEIEMSN